MLLLKVIILMMKVLYIPMLILKLLQKIKLLKMQLVAMVLMKIVQMASSLLITQMKPMMDSVMRLDHHYIMQILIVHMVITVNYPLVNRSASNNLLITALPTVIIKHLIINQQEINNSTRIKTTVLHKLKITMVEINALLNNVHHKVI